jgi:predicted peptidase
MNPSFTWASGRAQHRYWRARVLSAAVASVAMAACGGGGGSDPAPVPPPPGACTPAANPDTLELRAKGTTCAPLGYAQFVPGSYAGASVWPLIIYFHGDGEIGDGSAGEIGRLTGGGLTRQIQLGEWDPGKRFVVLSPQMQLNEMNAATVKQFIEFAKSNFKIDPRRIYLTGSSRGGDPLYAYLSAESGGEAAAAVPISALSDNADNNGALGGCTYKDVPLWLFHGSADTTVAPSASSTVFDRLGTCQPAEPPRFTEYSGVDHNAWSGTYDLSALNDAVQPGRQPYNQFIYDWMLQYARP